MPREPRAYLHDVREAASLIAQFTDGLDFDAYAADAMVRAAVERQFEIYTFDLGDDWTHLCTVGPERIDPVEVLGALSDVPLPFWGWGAIPDQYGRRWDGDDGEGRAPRNPHGADLPPLRPWWGARQ